MTRDELIEILRTSLTLTSETSSEYTGDLDGGGSLYKDVHTVNLTLNGEIIGSVTL